MRLSNLALKTYFNIGDSIADGLSSFMAEHRRMTELEAFASKTKDADNALILIDEPYAKTTCANPLVILPSTKA